MQTESAIKSKTIAAHEIPKQFETLLGEIKNGMEIKISRDGVVIARMVPEPVAAKKASLPFTEEPKRFSVSRPGSLFPNTWKKAGKSDFDRLFLYQHTSTLIHSLPLRFQQECAILASSLNIISDKGHGDMTPRELLTDIHALEEDLLAFERKYGIRSETFYAAYIAGEEPEDDNWVLDFGEWASVYRTWLARQADYRNEIQRIRPRPDTLTGLIHAAT
ncbi:MAG: hypothetical protein ACOC23_07975 [Thermodesulfobacteriota bacterium]